MNNTKSTVDDIEHSLQRHENKELVRLITCGNVDDGKSTLIGRLLYDSKVLFEDQLAAIVKDSKRVGKSNNEIDFSLLLDGLQSEREQGITIDVAYRFFDTNTRKYIIADTPGHEQYTRNMVTGASTANLAIILVDARRGVQTQTKRHSFIVKLLGISHVIVVINKMDLVQFSEQRYEEVRDSYVNFSKELGIEDVQCIPISALYGDTIVSHGTAMPWYKGESLMERLEHINIIQDTNYDDFRFPVQYVNRPHLNFRGFSGTIASGTIAVGDSVCILPSRQQTRIKEIVKYNTTLTQASAGMAVTLVLEDEVGVSRGDFIVNLHNIPRVSQNIDAHMVWMDQDAMKLDHPYYIKQGTMITQGVFNTIYYKKDVNTLEECRANTLNINEIGKVQIKTSKDLIFDAYQENRQTGRFIVIDRMTNNTVGAGMIMFQDETEPGLRKNKGSKMGAWESFLYRYMKKKYPHWGIM